MPIPPRAAAASSSLIDLSGHYNAALHEGWHDPGLVSVNNLSRLPAGCQRFAGVEFDVRGIVQLAGRYLKQNVPDYPVEVTGIRIARKCHQLHFLHSTGWNAPRGTRIGVYRLHFEDGQQQQVPIIFGNHMLDWIGRDALARNDHSVEAWRTNRNEHTTERLFMTTWRNP